MGMSCDIMPIRFGLDDQIRNAFDPAIKGKTDRFLRLYRSHEDRRIGSDRGRLLRRCVKKKLGQYLSHEFREGLESK